MITLIQIGIPISLTAIHSLTPCFINFACLPYPEGNCTIVCQLSFDYCIYRVHVDKDESLLLQNNFVKPLFKMQLNALQFNKL